MAVQLTVKEQIKQLNDARKLVLSDANYYPQIIQGILPIIGPGTRVELRRWGADFLADTFASPTVPAQQKESLSLIVLETLKSMVENPQEDNAVVKSVVQTAASIYPLVFRWMYVAPLLFLLFLICPFCHTAARRVTSTRGQAMLSSTMDTTNLT